MRRVLGVTCARGGSKGVPGKNIRLLAGKPLIAWTIEEALKSKYITRYIVSTDSEEIAEVAKKYGADVPFLRPPELAGDDTPTLPVLLHALHFCEKQDNVTYDIIADLRCTNPLKNRGDIDGAIKKIVGTDSDVVVGVSRLEDHHPARIKRIVNDALVDFWPEPMDGQRHLLKPDAYIRNGSIYVVWRSALEQGILLGGSDKIRPWIMPPERSCNIDEEVDFLIAEAVLAKR